MIKKKLIHFNTYSAFEDGRSLLYDWSIAFIAETKQIYTHGNFYDCNIEDINELNDKIDEILDNIYVDAEYTNGVYAVTATGELIAYNDAAVDATCLGVALITDNQKIMIEKMGEANAEWNSNTSLCWGTNLYGKNVAGITETTNETVAEADFSGKEHTNAIIAAYTEHSVEMDARDMCSVLQTFNDGENNGGFTDWYIPACGQLALILLNKTAINEALTAIGGTTFSNSYYWSSSEYSSDSGWRVYFGGIGVYNGLKSIFFQVRFVRDLSLKQSIKDKLTKLEKLIPTSTSQLTNDSDFITSEALPTKLSELTDDVVSGNYLSINGGTLNGDLIIRTSSNDSTLIVDAIQCPYYFNSNRSYMIEFDRYSISVNDANETQLFTIRKAFIDFYEGSNTATSVASLPIDKRLIITTISASASLTLSETPCAGREIHIIVNNSSTSAISIALPNTGKYVCLTDTALSIDAGAYAEINVISDGSKMYIRSI